MKILKPLLVVWFLACAAQSAAAGTEESFQGALPRGAAPHPSQYSFADIYRLTVSGPAPAGFPLGPAHDSPMRVAVTQAAPAAQFSIGAVPEPQLWLLVLSGLAAAAWVARRRLNYSF